MFLSILLGMPQLQDPFCSSPLVPALFVLLCAQLMPAMSYWLGLLLLMRLCLLVTLCSLLAWCAVACILAHCHPGPVMPGIAPLPIRPTGGAETKAPLG
jgi:multisubunit Na+/H+ antiporter MnhE subunit